MRETVPAGRPPRGRRTSRRSRDRTARLTAMSRQERDRLARPAPCTGAGMDADVRPRARHAAPPQPAPESPAASSGDGRSPDPTQPTPEAAERPGRNRSGRRRRPCSPRRVDPGVPYGSVIVSICSWLIVDGAGRRCSKFGRGLSDWQWPATALYGITAYSAPGRRGVVAAVAGRRPAPASTTDEVESWQSPKPSGRSAGSR